MSMRYQAGILTASYFPLKVPDAPTIGTLTNTGATTLSIAFTAPSNVGAGPITGYTAIATDSSSGATFTSTGSSSPITISGLTTGNTYTARVVATNAFGSSARSGASNSAVPASLTGQQAYTTAGTYSWVAPTGITSVSVVVIGGGGSGFSGHDSCGGNGGSLGYKNNITVVPGTSYTVVVGAGGAAPGSQTATSNAGGESYFINTSTVQANGGSGGNGSNLGPTPSNGGFNGDGGGAGGAGRSGSTRSGGGGAGGYNGNGGETGYAIQISGPNAGSGAASGGISLNDVNGAAGGGVGILGLGATATAPVYDQNAWGNGLWTYSFPNAEAFTASQGGNAGSGGTDPVAVAVSGGAAYPFRTDGGLYGGGGGGAYNSNGGQGGQGGVGAVRIIWPGTTRQFPSTNTGNL
jgi:hypothetical protein